MGELSIVLRQPPGDHGSTELAVAGPLTHATTRALRDYLRHLLATTTTPGARILLDMSCSTNIDVDGLLALAVGQHAAQIGGGDLRLVHNPLSSPVRYANTTLSTFCWTRLPTRCDLTNLRFFASLAARQARLGRMRRRGRGCDVLLA